MKTTKEMIEVMQAFERGERIEAKSLNNDIYGWDETKEPFWDWHNLDYRVKPKINYVPFDTAEEFFAAQRVHGEFVENKESGEKMNAYVDKNGIVVLVTALCCTHTFESLTGLFIYYQFSDGTPCGIEKEIEL